MREISKFLGWISLKCSSPLDGANRYIVLNFGKNTRFWERRGPILKFVALYLRKGGSWRTINTSLKPAPRAEQHAFYRTRISLSDAEISRFVYLHWWSMGSECTYRWIERDVVSVTITTSGSSLRFPISYTNRHNSLSIGDLGPIPRSRGLIVCIGYALSASIHNGRRHGNAINGL